MSAAFKSRKTLFTVAVAIIVLLNAFTLAVAYPTLDKPLNFGAGDVPRDFSVYYLAAWRMLHNPSQSYNIQPLNDGEPAIYPPITPYKYLPSFLVMVAPLLSLSYYQAFWVFDAVQFVLIPLMAFLFYLLLEKKPAWVVLVVMVAVLILPYPMVGRGLSVSFFMSWVEGQAKILLAFLLLLSFYLGYKGKSGLSGIAFALGAFDPRFLVLALPLFVFFNQGRLRRAVPVMGVVLLVLNGSVFYPGVAQGLVGMIFSFGTTTPFYTPSYIPVVMLLCLYLVYAKELSGAVKNSKWLGAAAVRYFASERRREGRLPPPTT